MWVRDRDSVSGRVRVSMQSLYRAHRAVLPAIARHLVFCFVGCLRLYIAQCLSDRLLKLQSNLGLSDADKANYVHILSVLIIAIISYTHTKLSIQNGL